MWREDFLMIYRKMVRFKERHGDNFFKGFFRESLAKIMRNAFLRSVISRFFPKPDVLGMVFMSGCYNSGTTIIKDAICLHPMLCSPPVEGSAITTDLVDFDVGYFPRGLYSNLQDVANMKLSFFDKDRFRLEISPWCRKNTMFLDKSISNTVMLNQLNEAFPNCFVINVIREPYSTIAGIKKKSTPPAMFVDIMGEQYSDDFLLAQWEALYSFVVDSNIPNDRFFNIDFSEFEKNPVQTIKSVWSFLGLPLCDISYSNGVLVVSGSQLLIRQGEELDRCSLYLNMINRLDKKAETRESCN
tara:strand:+ start:8428 stop:9327 length:900 start_codon:yes stop_codon:yes gene_type:complete